MPRAARRLASALLLAATLALLLPGPTARPATAQELVIDSTTAQPTERHEVFQRLSAASLELILANTIGGTAVIVDPQGIALTAAHGLLGHPEKIEVVDSQGNRVPAEVLAIDLRHDLALLQLPPREDDYPHIPIAENSPLAGDDIFLFGSPLFRRPMMQRGMVAHDHTSFEFYPNLNAYVEITYISASAQPGTSGGPWVNARGELVGIQLSIMGGPTSPMGVAMMAPLEALRDLVEHREFVPVPCLGAAFEELWEHPPEVTTQFPDGIEGLVLRLVQPQGALAQAGLEEWDLITAVDGQPVQRIYDMGRLLDAQESEAVLTLTVLSPHDDEPRELEIPLQWLQLNWEPLEVGSRN